MSYHPFGSTLTVRALPPSPSKFKCRISSSNDRLMPRLTLSSCCSSQRKARPKVAKRHQHRGPLTCHHIDFAYLMLHGAVSVETSRAYLLTASIVWLQPYSKLLRSMKILRRRLPNQRKATSECHQLVTCFVVEEKMLVPRKPTGHHKNHLQAPVPWANDISTALPLRREYL